MRRYRPPDILDYRDHAVADFIARMMRTRPLTFLKLSAATRQLYGADRAWSPIKVHAFLYYTKHSCRRNELPTTIIGRDGQIRQFIENRAGYLPVSEIARQVRKRFKGRRVPSRPTIARFISELRRRRNIPHFF